MGRGGWRGAAADLVDLVLPASCAGCALDGSPLCAGCGSVLRAGARALDPGSLEPGTPLTVAALAYQGVGRSVVLGWKARGRHDLTPALGAALAGALVLLDELTPRAAAQRGPAAGLVGTAMPVGRRTVLVPVPSGRRSERARGAHLTADLARAASLALRSTGHAAPAVVVGRAGLVLGRQPADQVGLTGAQRSANVRGAHRASPRLWGARCVVVDDVVTTGSTLEEASRALRSVGAVVVGAVTVAAARPPDGAGRDDAADERH